MTIIVDKLIKLRIKEKGEFPKTKTKNKVLVEINSNKMWETHTLQ